MVCTNYLWFLNVYNVGITIIDNVVITMPKTTKKILGMVNMVYTIPTIELVMTGGWFIVVIPRLLVIHSDLE